MFYVLILVGGLIVLYVLILVGVLICSFSFFSGGNESFCVLRTLRYHIEHALRSSGCDIMIDRFRDNLNCILLTFSILDSVLFCFRSFVFFRSVHVNGFYP